MNEQDQEAFENWAADKGLDLTLTTNGIGLDKYQSVSTQAAFSAWLAALTHRDGQLAEVTRQRDEYKRRAEKAEDQADAEAERLVIERDEARRQRDELVEAVTKFSEAEEDDVFLDVVEDSEGHVENAAELNAAALRRFDALKAMRKIAARIQPTQPTKESDEARETSRTK